MQAGPGYYDCYEYSARDFATDPKLKFERAVLAIPGDWPKFTRQPLIFLLLDRRGRALIASQYLECTSKKDGEFRCGGECDAGEIFMRADRTLYLRGRYRLEVDLPTGKYQEEKRAKFDIVSSSGESTPFPAICPLYVERLYNRYRDGEGNDDPLLNVCYDNKRNLYGRWLYRGCSMQSKRCDAIGKKNFGHYEDIESTYRGFLRCKDSTPNP